MTGRPAILLAGLLGSASVCACGRQAPLGPELPPPPPPQVVSTYFAAAFGDRHDGPQRELRRWAAPVRIGLSGVPTYEDRSYVRVMVRRLSELTGPARLSLDDGDLDVELRFVPWKEIPPLPVEGVAAGQGLSRFRATAGEDGELESCDAVIPAGDEVPQYMRLNLILEALVGCLGLAGTVPRPDESVFYAGPNWYVEALAPVDREVIRLHHATDLHPGMTRDEVRAALRARLGPVRPGPTPGTPHSR